MIRIQMILEMHGIICCILLILSIVGMKMNRDTEGRTLTLLLGMIALNLAGDIAAIYLGGRTDPKSIQLFILSLTFVYAMESLMVIVCGYLIHLGMLKNHVQPSPYNLKIVVVLGLICLIGALLTPRTGMFFTVSAYGIYHVGRWYGLLCLCMLVSWLLILWPLFRYKEQMKRMRHSMSLIIILPFLGVVAEILWPQYSVMNLGLSFAIIVTALVELYSAVIERRKQEYQLVQDRTYLLNSQIKPHFLFNSLSVIQSLVEEDPEVAYDAIGHFSKFLRKGMSLESVEQKVSLEEEMEYVRHYLYLEKLRFGDKLNIVYDIPEGIHFRLPFLTIQPLVENAVRHGVRKKVDGGTVTVRIWKEYKHYVIRVEDDGVGFDVEEVMSEESRKKRLEEGHGVGLDNVSERLRLMAGGTMQIASSPERGTWVTVTIPLR